MDIKDFKADCVSSSPVYGEENQYRNVYNIRVSGESAEEIKECLTDKPELYGDVLLSSEKTFAGLDGYKDVFSPIDNSITLVGDYSKRVSSISKENGLEEIRAELDVLAYEIPKLAIEAVSKAEADFPKHDTVTLEFDKGEPITLDLNEVSSIKASITTDIDRNTFSADIGRITKDNWEEKTITTEYSPAPDGTFYKEPNCIDEESYNVSASDMIAEIKAASKDSSFEIDCVYKTPEREEKSKDIRKDNVARE